jgi:hypothetical protein
MKMALPIPPKVSPYLSLPLPARTPAPTIRSYRYDLSAHFVFVTGRGTHEPPAATPPANTAAVASRLVKKLDRTMMGLPGRVTRPETLPQRTKTDKQLSDLSTFQEEARSIS